MRKSCSAGIFKIKLTHCKGYLQVFLIIINDEHTIHKLVNAELIMFTNRIEKTCTAKGFTVGTKEVGGCKSIRPLICTKRQCLNCLTIHGFRR